MWYELNDGNGNITSYGFAPDNPDNALDYYSINGSVRGTNNQGYDPVTKAITDYVQITTSGTNSILKVDVDGGANNFVQIATLNGITGITDEQALVNSGHLIVS